MLLSFTCAHCQSELEADASRGGTNVCCPQCGEPVRVPVPRIQPGTTLGNFHIDAHIGSGGMGDVYAATQVSMDRKVALKILPQALTRDSSALERFLYEVRLSARLEHPHIVTAFEAGEDYGYYYLAMSYVDGEQLGRYLKTKGPMPEPEALRIVRQVAGALAYAWDQFRILHRDIKPANIMLDRAGNAKLMDMGISKSLIEEDAGLTLSGTLVGTPHYMSPEQAGQSGKLDFRSDMYSLGATLYHLVTGSTPYPGKTTVEVLRQLALGPYSSARERRPDLSEGCCALVETMMARLPEHRHTSWQELIADVDRVLEHQFPKTLIPRDQDATPPPNTAPDAVPIPLGEGTRAGGNGVAMLPAGDDSRQGRQPWLRRKLVRAALLLCVLAVGVGLVAAILNANILGGRRHAGAAGDAPRASAPAAHVAGPSAGAQPTGPGARSRTHSPGHSPAAPRAAAAKHPRKKRPSAAYLKNRNFTRLMDKVVADYMEGRALQVAETLRAARDDPALADCRQPLRDIAFTLGQARTVADKAIMETFSEDLGKVISVELRDRGTVKVKVRLLRLGQVIGSRVGTRKGGGTGRFAFSLAELTPAEMVRRLKPASRRPPVALALGMIHLREGDVAAARQSFRRVQPGLREALLRYLKGHPDIKVALPYPRVRSLRLPPPLPLGPRQWPDPGSN